MILYPPFKAFLPPPKYIPNRLFKNLTIFTLYISTVFPKGSKDLPRAHHQAQRMSQPAWQRAGPQRNVTRGRCVGVGQAQGTRPKVLAGSRALLGLLGHAGRGRYQAAGRRKGQKETQNQFCPTSLPHLGCHTPREKAPTLPAAVSSPASAGDTVNQEVKHSGWHPIHLQLVCQHSAASLEESVER